MSSAEPARPVDRAARDELLDRFEAVCERFLAAGPPGERPVIDAFLPDDPALCQEVLPGLVKIDLECPQTDPNRPEK
jgi:hypothetical protein